AASQWPARAIRKCAGSCPSRRWSTGRPHPPRLPTTLARTRPRRSASARPKRARRAAREAGATWCPGSEPRRLLSSTDPARRDLLAPARKEAGQARPRPRLVHAGIDLRPVVAGRGRIEAHAILDRAALRIRRAVIQAADAGKADGGGAHGAGLERDMQAGAGQPLAADPAACLANRQHLGMGGGVVEFACPVAGARQHLAIQQDDRTDRDFATLRRCFCLGEREVHGFVAHSSRNPGRKLVEAGWPTVMPSATILSIAAMSTASI